MTDKVSTGLRQSDHDHAYNPNIRVITKKEQALFNANRLSGSSSGEQVNLKGACPYYFE
jgi:hypothetical protein